MNKSKWPDFLFTIAVRSTCGIVLGGLACFLFTWKGILRAFSHNNAYAPLIWLGLCGMVGGIIGAFTIPRWQTPWYKRETELLNLTGELELPQGYKKRSGTPLVKKSVTIKTVDEGGETHEYTSMEEVPTEIRPEIEALEKENVQGPVSEVSITETSRTGNAITSKIIRRQNISVYKIIDDSGAERTYHSLREMPPEIRAAVEEAEQNLQG